MVSFIKSVSESHPINEPSSTRKDLRFVSPSASTTNPLIVIVAAVRSPAVSIFPVTFKFPTTKAFPTASNLPDPETFPAASHIHTLLSLLFLIFTASVAAESEPKINLISLLVAWLSIKIWPVALVNLVFVALWCILKSAAFPKDADLLSGKFKP